MTTKTKLVTLLVVVGVAFSLTVGYWIAVQPRVSAAPLFEACTKSTALPAPTRMLTASNPTILSAGASYNLSEGPLPFCVVAPVTVHGIWSSTSRLSFGVVNLTEGAVSCNYPCLPNGYVRAGNFNDTLIPPGLYAIDFVGDVYGSEDAVVTVAQSIGVDFDPVVEGVQGVESVEILSHAYLAWTLPLPAGARDIWIQGSSNTTACSSEMAILPPSLFAAFKTDPAAIQAPGSIVLGGGSSSPCPVLPASFYVGPGWSGPWNITANDTLVFYNFSHSSGQFWVSADIRLIYLPSI
ncbi:MAG: hypothetical protein WAK40_05860 [Thermoplasmata archaeon]